MDYLKDYDRRTLAADVGAGITVGVIALPLAALATILLFVAWNMGDWANSCA